MIDYVNKKGGALSGAPPFYVRTNYLSEELC
jgi:hypothetical protein